ncbi:MAG: hypothetical protein IJ125_07375 [Atopobiaceae bacterium]|nr:hypothetical protein [Atopobiaceae bacterium]
MSGLIVCAGVACGLLASAAPVYALYRRNSKKLSGLLVGALVLLPFVLLQGALLAVAHYLPDELLTFGVASIVSYVLVVLVAVLVVAQRS